MRTSESKDTSKSLNLVWLWFRSSHLGLDAKSCELLNRHTRFNGPTNKYLSAGSFPRHSGCLHGARTILGGYGDTAMTPAERKLVTDLFDRLATLEDAPRDPDAERVIRDGLAQAPNAVYALVQTALVQDEALKNANVPIQQLESQLGTGNAERHGGGFLDSMRSSIWGRKEEPRGSVPNVRPADAPMGAPPQFGAPGQYPGQYPGQQPGPYQGQTMGGTGYQPQGQMQPPGPGRGGWFL